jgi:hypothetical protein
MWEITGKMPFSVINDINAGKEPKNPEKFSPWLTNRFFSFFPDTLFFAQLMNQNYDLDPRLQIGFLINTVRPSKRWQKWLKRNDDKKDLDYALVQEWYGFSDRKVKEALSVLTEDQIKVIRNKNKKE